MLGSIQSEPTRLLITFFDCTVVLHQTETNHVVLKPSRPWQIILQEGSFLAGDGQAQSETYTIQVHEAVDDLSAVVADHVTVGGIVVGEHGQQIRYEQVVEGRPAGGQGGEEEDGSNPQTVEIVVHPPEEQQVFSVAILNIYNCLSSLDM